MEIKSRVKKVFIKADSIKEDIEDDIAALLEKLPLATGLEDGEKALIKTAIATGVSSASSGAVTLTPEQLEVIATAIITGQNKLAKAAAIQLKKR